MLRAPLWLAALVLFTSAPAAAYLPSTGSLLRRAGERQDELAMRTLTAKGAGLLRHDAARDAARAFGLAEEPELAVRVELAYRSPGSCRITLRPLIAEGSPLVAQMISGKLQPGGAAEIQAIRGLLVGACPLLSARSSGKNSAVGQFQHALQRLGASTQDLSLARLDKQIAYRIGAKTKGAAQVWFDKETLLPMRVVLASNAGGFDVRLLDRSAATGAVHPRRIEVVGPGGETPSVRIQIDRVELNRPVEGL